MPRAFLISRCLLGEACRFDGRPLPSLAEKLEALGISLDDAVPICPEVEGGLPTPRTPSEIEPNRSAADVLKGCGAVRMKDGSDATAAYVAGARLACAKAAAAGAAIALLKEKSPSCGSSKIHDGSFSGTLRPGRGVAAEMLSQAGLDVMSESEIERFRACYFSGQFLGSRGLLK